MRRVRQLPHVTVRVARIELAEAGAQTGGPPWAMTLVPRARIERASPRLQRGAFTRAAIEGWYRVRVSSPSLRLERPTISPEIQRGTGTRSVASGTRARRVRTCATCAQSEPASGVEPPWASLRRRCPPARATPALRGCTSDVRPSREPRLQELDSNQRWAFAARLTAVCLLRSAILECFGDGLATASEWE